MAILLAFLGLLALSSASVIQPRIVNGVEAMPGQFPYQVSIQWKASLYHVCGGAILNENYILTSANCIRRDRPSNLIVNAGTLRFDRPTVTKKVEKIILHDDYDQATPQVHDIALIKVDTPFKYNDLIQPIGVASPADTAAVGTPAVVTGWGPPFRGELTARFLVMANVSVTDQEQCRKVYDEISEKILDTQMCAYNPDIRNGPCFTDAGGPMVINGKVHGIIQRFHKCLVAEKNVPIVYTRVSSYYDWIMAKAV